MHNDLLIENRRQRKAERKEPETWYAYDDQFPPTKLELLKTIQLWINPLIKLLT